MGGGTTPRRWGGGGGHDGREAADNPSAVIGGFAGIIGAVFGVAVIPIPALTFGALGILFGAIGWMSAVNEPERGRAGLAVVGLLLGVIAVVLAVAGFAIVSEPAFD